jgi:hypothetical protein
MSNQDPNRLVVAVARQTFEKTKYPGILRAHRRGCSRVRCSICSIARPRDRADLFHICDGRVTRLVLYFDREHAFADLGLRAQASPFDLVRWTFD